MDIVKAIYTSHATLIAEEEENGYIEVCIGGDKYLDLAFYGSAFLHPDDKDFYSPKVGYNIALMNARINALHYYWEKQDKKAIEAWKYYCRVSNCGNLGKEHLLTKARTQMAKAEKIRHALNDEKEAFHAYLNGQHKVV